MTPDDARTLLGSARVARLATVAPDGRPHLVPVCFALAGDAIVTAVDAKAKRTTQLQRLANIASDEHVCVLADHYDEDWKTLWWARADGTAAVVAPGEPGHAEAVAALSARYPQYAAMPPLGVAIVVTVSRWSGWRAR